MNEQELMEKSSKEGYEIYENLSKKYPEDTHENMMFMSNCLVSALIYFAGNEIYYEDFDTYEKVINDSIKLGLANMREHLKDKKRLKEEPNYIFSKELRDRMAKFANKNIADCLQNPEFFEELMNHAGMTEQEKKELMKIVKNDGKHKQKT